MLENFDVKTLKEQKIMAEFALQVAEMGSQSCHKKVRKRAKTLLKTIKVFKNNTSVENYKPVYKAVASLTNLLKTKNQ